MPSKKEKGTKPTAEAGRKPRRHRSSEVKDERRREVVGPSPSNSSKTKSRSSSSTSPSRKSKKKASLPGTEAPALSEEEFLRLPLCIQRKYFSSLERLHIAYSSVHQTNPSPTGAWSDDSSANASSPSRHRRHPTSPAPTTHLPNSSPSRATKSAHTTSRRSEPLVHQSQASFSDVLAYQAKAQWFFALSPKIRSQLFSHEEQERLAAALAPYTGHMKQTHQHSYPQHQSEPSHTVALPRKPRKSSRRETSPSQDLGNLSGTERTMDMSPRGRQPDRTSNGRRLTISRQAPTPQAWIPSSQSPNPSSTPLFAGHRRDRSHTTMKSLHRPSVDTVATAIDPDAVYYRNPEARHKLRQYLASPQKFDEALTYGFPSAAQQDDSLGQTYRMPESTSHNDAKAFLDHDLVSFMDTTGSDPDLDPGSYQTSDNGTDSPATPADQSFSWRSSKYNRVSIFGSLDTESLPSLDLKFAPEPETMFATTSMAAPLYSSRASNAAYAMPAPHSAVPSQMMNREMTLRMTLTRPDLRANDEDLYGWRRPEDDPLALADLPSPIDDASGQSGAFPMETARTKKSKKSKAVKSSGSNGIARMFKKMGL